MRQDKILLLLILLQEATAQGEEKEAICGCRLIARGLLLLLLLSLL